MEEDKNISQEETGSQVVAKTATTEENTSNNKTFTQEDVNKLVSDLKKQVKAKAEEEKAKAVAEAQRLAQLSAEERASELAKQHEEELARRERNLALGENRIKAMDILSQNGVPTRMVDYLIDVDEDVTIERVNQFVKDFNEQVNLGVASKLKGVPPVDVASNKETNLSTESVPRVL